MKTRAEPPLWSERPSAPEMGRGARVRGTVRLTVQRSHSGSIDSAFTEGGENKAYQLRAQSFTSP